MLNHKYLEIRHIYNNADNDDINDYDRIEIYIDGELAQEFNRDARTDIDAESEAFVDAVCYLIPDIQWDYT